MSAQFTPDRGTGDMFLLITGAKSGKIKGESLDDAHKDEIQVLRWSWGMQSKSDLATGQAKGRATVQDLKIVKKVDRASTPLMVALRTNEEIKEAVLTLRKAGQPQLEYLKVTIGQGRVTALTIDAGDFGGGSDMLEHVSFSFNKLTVEYVPQGKDGQAMGSLVYQDEWHTG
jgi:type VI secretion system secreted protein Hcp